MGTHPAEVIMIATNIGMKRFLNFLTKRWYRKIWKNKETMYEISGVRAIGIGVGFDSSLLILSTTIR